LYELRKEGLSLLEEQSRSEHIDLFYADEARVSQEGYVPYGWQFRGEDVHIATSKGRGINCFAMLSRSNQLVYELTQSNLLLPISLHYNWKPFH